MATSEDVNFFYSSGAGTAAPVGVVVKDGDDTMDDSRFDLAGNSINIIESQDTFKLPKGEVGLLIKIANPNNFVDVVLEPFLDDKIQNQDDNETLILNDANASLELFYTGDTYGWLITNAT